MAVALATCFGALGAAGQQAGSVPLFAAEDVVELTLMADFAQLKDDRRGDTPERPGTVSMQGSDGAEVSLDVKVRTRGRFRRETANCSFPPLRINFKKKQVDGTVFAGQDKLKMVGSCRPGRDSYEQLVLQEYLAYEAFQQVSQTAFQVRLARVTYVDSSGENDTFTRFAFFIEDDDALAARMGAEVFDLPEGTNLPPGALDVPTAATVAVFQYMIGNTDWSDVAGHNMEIVDLHGIALPVPYDFDFSGLVDAPYSTPDPILNLRDVKDRLYRGWCFSGMNPGMVLDNFRSAEAGVMDLYENFPYLSDGERGRAVNYLSEFFDGIETDEKAERRMFRDCRSVRTASR